MSKTPTAKLKEMQSNRLSIAWVVPTVAIVLSLVLFIRWEMNRGPEITVSFTDANGITIDSPIMFRGAIVGRVKKLSLQKNNSTVIVQARLDKTAASLAKRGSHWWIVHPSVSLQGISGLDTIIGPRYIQVSPGDGEPSFTFEGSQKPIPIECKSFTLISSSAIGITTGTPIYYRGIEIGSVTTTELAKNAATARIVASIQNMYAPIVRTNSKFWNVSGINIDAGLTGITLHSAPLTALIRGGITMATPTSSGDIAPDGFAFTLLEEFEDAWLEWTPEIDLSNVEGTQ